MKKTLGLFVSCFAFVLALTSCGGSNYSSAGYNTYYTEDFETLNYLVSSKQKDSDFFADMVDGLVEADRFGVLQPCLAKSYSSKVNDDGNMDWTFNIRKDVKWVDSDQEVYAEVTANDWVSAAQYMLNPANNGGTVSMWFTFIVGAEDYYNAQYIVQNFASADAKGCAEAIAALGSDALTTYAQCKTLAAKSVSEAVGIEAVNDYTLKYTVIGEQSYFDSVLTYAAFFPVYGPFLQEEGTAFGTSREDILSCGAYTMSSRLFESYIVMTANPTYWDAEHVYVKQIHYAFVGSIVASTTRTLYEAGEIDGFSVSARDAEGYKKYVTGEDGTGTLQNPATDVCYLGKGVGTGVYAAAFNFDRVGTGTVAQDLKGMIGYTKHTDATYANTQKAILNTNFRKIFLYGMDFNAINESVYTGEGLGLTYQCKGWTIPELCSADGHDYTYYFAEYFASKNNTTTDNAYANLYNSATTDIIYNVDKAKEYARTAYTELKAQGVTFPVYIETFGDQDAETNAIYKEFCDLFTTAMTIDGVKLFDFDVHQPTTTSELYAYFYYGNYDFTFSTGWGPDYSDPLTFLNCYVIDGDAEDSLGLTGSTYEAQILTTYTNLVNAANAIVNPKKKAERYEAFAKAEYQLIYEDAVVIPTTQSSAERVYISKVLPYTSLRSLAGLSASKHKYMVVADSVVSQAQYQALRTAFKEDKTNAAIDKVIEKILNGSI